jgi:hypothetical protein
VLVAVVVLGVLSFLGGSTPTLPGAPEDAQNPPNPLWGERPPYPPRINYGNVEDVVIQDIGITSVKTTEGAVFGPDATIAIFNFESPQETQGGILVSDTFAAVLRREGYQVVERSELERILSEQQLLIDGQVVTNDLNIAQTLGQLEQADYMIFGAVTLYQSEGQTLFLPVRVHDDDRAVYEEEYSRYRDWYLNGFQLSFDRWLQDPSERLEKLRVEYGIPPLAELEYNLNQNPREEFRTVATIGISAKIVDVRTGEIVWMGQAETTDFTLVDGANRIVEEFFISITE